MRPAATTLQCPCRRWRRCLLVAPAADFKQTLSPPLYPPPILCPIPLIRGLARAGRSVSGSCASADRWYHQLDWQGAEQSSPCDGSRSKRAHGGCSGARFRTGGGRVAMEWPHKPFTSSRCWAAAERRGRIPKYYPRPAAPLPGVLSRTSLGVPPACHSLGVPPACHSLGVPPARPRSLNLTYLMPEARSACDPHASEPRGYPVAPLFPASISR